MGKYSNLILVQQSGKIIDSVCRVTDEISRVREVLPGLMYQRPPQQGKMNYAELDRGALANALRVQPGPLSRALQATVSGLSPQTAREIALRAAGDESAAVDEGNTALLEAVNTALNELIDDGTVQAIMDKYITAE